MLISKCNCGFVISPSQIMRECDKFPSLHLILLRNPFDSIHIQIILFQAQESPEPIYDLIDCGLKTIPSGVFSKCKVLRKEALLLQVAITTFCGLWSKVKSFP